MEVYTGRADAAPAIRAVADIFELDFVPLRWERYDLLISKNRFFEEGVQLFLNLMHENAVKKIAQELNGYDLSVCGKMVFQHQTVAKKGKTSEA
jgi:molybdate-binding protein